MTGVATRELDSLVRREHANPHSILGAHPQDGGVVIRALRPAARAITAVLDDGTSVELEQIHAGGVFEGVASGQKLPLRYRLEIDYGGGDTYTIIDPYSFLPTLGELDLHLFSEGRHEELYDRLGAHVRDHRRRDRHGVLGVGAVGAGGQRGRRLQLAGTAACTRCAARLDGDLGDVPARRRRRAPATSTRSSPPTASSR